MKEFQGKRVLITGGSKGIGKCIAAAFYRCGAEVVIASSSEDNLASAAAEIQNAGADLSPGTDAGEGAGTGPDTGKLETFCGDLRKLEECQRLYDFVSQGKELSILINSAGATRAGDFLQLEDELWHDGFALKFYASVRLSRLFWQQLKNTQGSVINIIGIYARTPPPDFLLGGAVNGALANFTKGLSKLGMRDGVRVNAIYPGSTESERFEALVAAKAKLQGKTPAELKDEIFKRSGIRRFGKVQDIANLTLFLSSEAAEHIQGVAISVDGGETSSLF